MTFRIVFTATAAAALLGGAAYAQPGAVSPGVTPNQPMPASPMQSQTGLPSVDSTRATGQDAGATSLPGGRIEGGASAQTDHSGHAAGASTDADAATASGAGAGTDASATAYSATAVSGTGATYTATMVTNGPVPDTAENRQRYGGPMSNAGKRTQPAGN